MYFDPDQLQTLAAVIDEGSFDRAASRLHITASAVSQRIKALELASGQVLVQRTAPAQPTPAGSIVLRHSRQLELLSADLGRELGGSTHSGDRITVPIAVNADSLATWFLGCLAAVADSQGVVFDLHRDDEEHTTALLRSGTVMAAVTSTPEPVQGCRSERLGALRYRAVCSASFASRWMLHPTPPGPASAPAGDSIPDVSPDALRRSPIVNFDRKDTLQASFLDRLAPARTASTTRPATHFVPTSADFAHAIVLGLGWGLLPEPQCLDQIEAGVLVELDPRHPVDVALYWQRWNLRSRVLDAVTDAVRAGARASLHQTGVQASSDGDATTGQPTGAQARTI